MSLAECTEEELQALYEWVDSVPLSRPKRSIARDFADGVLMAEIVHHYFPKMVELHNYSAAHNMVQKMYNWNTLNQKVFKRMGFQLAREHCEAVCNAEAGAVERVLKLVRAKMARFQETGSRMPSRQAASGAAAAAAAEPAGSSSQPESPASYPQYATGGGAFAAADSIAALRIAADVPSKLLAHAGAAGGFAGLDQALAASLAEKEQQLQELRENNEILETKIGKLEQLVRLKDAKIHALLAKLASAAQAAQEAANPLPVPPAAAAAAPL